ncbi:MAG: beta-propeller domain-containing protein [Thaumarchaeota archaeon]|nr:beta-propeller domain-containing protein [Nitrososphaerota archaeon]
MQSVNRRGVGRNAAVFLAVISLIVAGTAILSFPPRAPLGSTSTSTNTSTSASTDTNASTIVGDAKPGTLSSFQTFQELHQFIAANAKSVQQQNTNYPGAFFGGTVTVQGGMTMTTTVGGPAVARTGVTMSTVTATATTTVGAGSTVNAGAGAAAGSPSYTTSNVQVQGVDELDKVKTDGTYLYVATSQSVSIIKAYPANSTSLVSTISLPSLSVLGITIAPQRLAVIAQSRVNASVGLRLYDVSNPASPHLLSSIGAAGDFVGARVTQGYFYMVVQQPSYVVSGNGNVTAAYPTVVEDGVSSVLAPGSTYYTPNRSQISVYTMVLSMSMSTGSERSDAVLTGPSSIIYVSASNIYVVYSNFYAGYVDGIAGDYFGGSGGVTRVGGVVQQQNSTVFRVAYSAGNITVKAAGSFPGGVLNQFSMDEYNGYFRVATSGSDYINGSITRSDDVYVLDQNLEQVGVIRNIAPGENIYSVRFEGDKGYVVTFEQIDPLFTISFADPAKPVILSALTVTGFSDYLQPFGTDYLIGVGKDAVAAPNGNFAWYLGMKLSLFHIGSDGNSTEVARYMIGDRGTDSAVLNDHLAFTFDSTTNTMVIPVDLYVVSSSQSQYPGSPPPFGHFVWQGAYVFNVSTSGFKLLGTVSQDQRGQSPGTHEIDRTVIIGNVLYTISQSEVMASDLTSFSTLATLQLSQP